MAKLPQDITGTAWEILQQLLSLVDEISHVEYELSQNFGETEDSNIAFSSLTEIRNELCDRYSQLSNALLRIAQMQPEVYVDALNVVCDRIISIQNRIPALNRSLEEIKQDWNLS